MTPAVLHIVHCIDTEGPLIEPIGASFERIRAIFGLEIEATSDNLKRLQLQQIPLDGLEEEVARVLRPDLLQYNNSWSDIQSMLEEAMSSRFRRQKLDSFGQGWVYSWHILDHVGYSSNPRSKSLGFGSVFNFYRGLLDAQPATPDEMNWHFHPVYPDGNPLKAATSYTNTYPLLNEILARRLLDCNWFPVCNRPGFHSERPDSHAFLEQWIPFDYANQSYESDSGQADLLGGRFGDWRRAPRSWGGYRPSHRDYQSKGDMQRWIFRCLNLGTRFRELQPLHVTQAFEEAHAQGSAILSFANHDYRDIRRDVAHMMSMVSQAQSSFPHVKIKFSGSTAAAQAHLTQTAQLATGQNLQLKMHLEGQTLQVTCTSGQCFGPQPFLAYKTKGGHYIHDNFDFQVPEKVWTYVFDAQTSSIDEISQISVGSAGADGSLCTRHIHL